MASAAPSAGKPPIDKVWPARNIPRPSIVASEAGALSPRSSPGKIFLWLDIGMLAVMLTRLRFNRLFVLSPEQHSTRCGPLKPASGSKAGVLTAAGRQPT